MQRGPWEVYGLMYGAAAVDLSRCVNELLIHLVRIIVPQVLLR